MSVKAKLSGRESEVLYWVAVGKTNWEMAVILSISVHTVKNHVKNILKKLDLSNRTQAAKFAIMEGMLDQAA